MNRTAISLVACAQALEAVHQGEDWAVSLVGLLRSAACEIERLEAAVEGASTTLVFKAIEGKETRHG